MLLYERVRPKSLDDVVGQDEVVRRLKSIQTRTGFGGRVFWFSGPSGSGKTTIARIVAAATADQYATVEIDAQRLSIEQLRELDQMCHFRPLGQRGFHAFIVNEAHGLSSKVVSELQTVLESEHVQITSTWIFTTTTAGQQRLFDTKFDALPFLSRAMMFKLNKIDGGNDAAAERLRVADGGPFELHCYRELLERCDGNMRKALNEIESGEFEEFELSRYDSNAAADALLAELAA